MAPPIKTKILKEHFICPCGLNTATQRETNLPTVKQVLSWGYKRRRFPDRSIFYFRKVELLVCHDDHDEDFSHEEFEEADSIEEYNNHLK